MTAKELIKVLKKMPQDTPVVIEVLTLTGKAISAKLDEAFEGCDCHQTEIIVLQGFDF